MQTRQVQVIIAASLFLVAFVLLYFFRAHDDNRLFSWVWMFSRTDGSQIYLLLIGALIGAYFLARYSPSERHDVLLLAVLPFTAALPFWTEPEIIVDASRYFTQAKHLAQYGGGFFLREWGRSIFAWTDLPLVPFCYGMLFRLFGESRMVIQAFTSLLFSLTVVLTYRTGRMLWDRETGMTAGLLLLGIPYLVTQVPLMLVDVPTMFLLMLSLAAFLDAMDRGGSARSVWAMATIVLFAFSKYSAWPMLSVHAVALIVFSLTRDVPGNRRCFRRGAAILAAAGAAAGMLVLLTYDVLSAQMRLLKEYQGPGLGRWQEGHVSTFLFQVHPFITLSAFASVAVAVRKRDPSYIIAVWLPLLLVVFNVQRIRYVLPVFPLLTLLAAYGLQTLSSAEVRRFVVWGVVTTSTAIAFSLYLPLAMDMSTVNLKRAGERLDLLEAREVQVITVPTGEPVVGPVVSLALLDLFTGKKLQYVPVVPERPLPQQDIERSPLRFSWEFPIPHYYDAGPPHRTDPVPIIVLRDRDKAPLPEAIVERLRGYRLSASFRSDDGIFRYAPQALLYERSYEDSH